MSVTGGDVLDVFYFFGVCVCVRVLTFFSFSFFSSSLLFSSLLCRTSMIPSLFRRN